MLLSCSSFRKLRKGKLFRNVKEKRKIRLNESGGRGIFDGNVIRKFALRNDQRNVFINGIT